jgi:hypothetical protein
MIYAHETDQHFTAKQCNMNKINNSCKYNTLTFSTILHCNKFDAVIKCEQQAVCHAAQWFILIT